MSNKIVTLDKLQINNEKTKEWVGNNYVDLTSPQKITGQKTFQDQGSDIPVKFVNHHDNGVSILANDLGGGFITKTYSGEFTLHLPGNENGILATQNWVEGVIAGKVDYLGVIASEDDIVNIYDAKQYTPGDYGRASTDFIIDEGMDTQEQVHSGDLIVFKKNSGEAVSSAMALVDIIHTEDPGNYVTLNTYQEISEYKHFNGGLGTSSISCGDFSCGPLFNYYNNGGLVSFGNHISDISQPPELYMEISDAAGVNHYDVNKIIRSVSSGSYTHNFPNESGTFATREWTTKKLTDDNEVPFAIVKAANGFKIGIPGDYFFLTYSYDGINFSDTNKSFSYPDHNGGILATREWVQAQNFGGGGSIDPANLMQLTGEGEQFISKSSCFEADALAVTSADPSVQCLSLRPTSLWLLDRTTSENPAPIIMWLPQYSLHTGEPEHVTLATQEWMIGSEHTYFAHQKFAEGLRIGNGTYSTKSINIIPIGQIYFHDSSKNENMPMVVLDANSPETVPTSPYTVHLPATNGTLATQEWVQSNATGGTTKIYASQSGTTEVSTLRIYTDSDGYLHIKTS